MKYKSNNKCKNIENKKRQCKKIKQTCARMKGTNDKNKQF